MILRSVTKHVGDQNWIAIAIDFAIVVIGVFFGIQVSNWNASRQETLRANGYLSRIHDDLSADQQSLARHAVFWRQVINQDWKLADAMDRIAAGSQDLGRGAAAAGLADPQRNLDDMDKSIVV